MVDHYVLSWAVPIRRTNPRYFFTAAAILDLGETILALGIGRPSRISYPLAALAATTKNSASTHKAEHRCILTYIPMQGMSYRDVLIFLVGCVMPVIVLLFIFWQSIF